jgi:hypothetical protein
MVDENCAKLEVARSFAIHGSNLAYCKVMVTTKYAKAAGISVDDCMQIAEPPESPVSTPVPAVAPEIIVPAPSVTVNIPPIVIPAPVVQAPPAPVLAKPVHKAAHKPKGCPTGEKPACVPSEK